MLSVLKNGGSSRIPGLLQNPLLHQHQRRLLATKPFRPRRRPSPSYRPVKLQPKDHDWARGNPNKFVYLDRLEGEGLDAEFGPLGADVVRDVHDEIERNLTFDEMVEDSLREADYMIAEPGSLEELVFERRALQGDEEFLSKVEDELQGRQMHEMELDIDDVMLERMRKNAPKRAQLQEEKELLLQREDQDDFENVELEPELRLDPNQKAFGQWSEMLVQVDRNIKLWRGGRLESYRALVVGGNLNGCGGLGFGKAKDPFKAVEIAGRRAKQNIYFVDRYMNHGLTRDLVGKQNSCIVTLRSNDNGLRGNFLICEILKRFGIVNCVAKSHGNRNPYNIVRATFKALITHESLEDIALKRGKRLVSMERAHRMQV